MKKNIIGLDKNGAAKLIEKLNDLQEILDNELSIKFFTRIPAGSTGISKDLSFLSYTLNSKNSTLTFR